MTMNRKLFDKLCKVHPDWHAEAVANQAGLPDDHPARLSLPEAAEVEAAPPMPAENEPLEQTDPVATRQRIHQANLKAEALKIELREAEATAQRQRQQRAFAATFGDETDATGVADNKPNCGDATSGPTSDPFTDTFGNLD